MIFALDGEVVLDARDFDREEIAIATCLRCGEQVELRHARPLHPRLWIHSDPEDAAMCSGDKDAVIDVLRERIWNLEENLRFLEAENKALRGER